MELQIREENNILIIDFCGDNILKYPLSMHFDNGGQIDNTVGVGLDIGINTNTVKTFIKI